MRYLKFNENQFNSIKQRAYNFVSGVGGRGEFNFKVSFGINVGVELSAVSSVSPAVL